MKGSKKLKEILCPIATLLLAGLLAACSFGGPASGSTGDGEIVDEKGYTERIADPFFKRGIKISSLHSSYGIFTPWACGGVYDYDAPWSLGQWGDLATYRTGYDSTVNDLTPADPNDPNDPATSIQGTDENGAYIRNKSGSRYMAINTETSTAVLRIDSSKEYVNQATGAIQPRTEGEDWAHTILQQSMAITVADYEEVIMSCNFKVSECTVYDSSIGASQFQWIFSVYDRTRKGKPKAHLWFIVSLFDNRYAEFPGIAQVDGGKDDATGSFMYGPSGQAIFGANAQIKAGRAYALDLNLKGQMRVAYDTAMAKGYLDASTRWEDITIYSFNIGWEVSNVSLSEVKIQNMSLRTK